MAEETQQMEASSPDHELEDVQQGEEEHRRSANESGPSVPNEGAPHTPEPNPTEGMETPDKELDMTNLTKVLLAGTGKNLKSHHLESSKCVLDSKRSRLQCKTRDQRNTRS